MIIQSKNVWISSIFTEAQIEMENGKVVAIYPYGTKEVDQDFGENRIIPGMIDVHCHGGLGFDTNDAHREGLVKWAKGLLEEGITGFCPTTVTQSVEVLTNAVANVAKVVEEGYEGAEILGIHFEGPYLNLKNKGAQPPQFIVTPSVEQFKEYQKAANGLIKIVTMATEMDPDFALTRYCAQNGVNVSIGHSGATFKDAVLAVANGANGMTHVYNGMNGLHHREPSLVGAAMRLKDVYGEIICDGNHVTPAALNAYFLSKGPDWPIMMSDSVMAKGTPAGSRFLFGGQEIEVYDDGSAHIIETGGLAGSTLRINEGLKILIEDALVPFNYALNACTINPARCLHLEHRKGSIQTGKDADLVVLNNDYSVHQTYARGKQCL